MARLERLEVLHLALSAREGKCAVRRLYYKYGRVPAGRR
jgi:hypothetical protein